MEFMGFRVFCLISIKTLSILAQDTGSRDLA